MFAEVEHGAEDVRIREAGHRRLFWVRLQVKSLERSILVGTAHLTHQRHPDESKTGVSTRVGETQRIIAALDRLKRKREPVFFMGDMNDPVHPTDHLHNAGYVSSFAALGLQPPPTFKCYPDRERGSWKARHQPVHRLDRREQRGTRDRDHGSAVLPQRRRAFGSLARAGHL